MSNEAKAILRATDIHSSQVWTTDPDMIEFYLSTSFAATADKAIKLMHEANVDQVVKHWGFSFKTFQDAENLDEDEIDGKEIHVVGDKKYIEFTPEYTLSNWSAIIKKDGEIEAVFDFKHDDDQLWCDIGTLAEIKQQLGLPPETSAPEKPRVLVVVSGGIADPIYDDGVDVEVFDWNDYKDDPDGTHRPPAHFADLANACATPVPVEQSK